MAEAVSAQSIALDLGVSEDFLADASRAIVRQEWAVSKIANNEIFALPPINQETN